MKGVILAAGKSTRSYPLTVDKPKSLIKVAGRSIIEHQLENLRGLVSEVVIVVGFKKDKIMEAIGQKFQEMKIVYAEQKEQLGTGHALLAAEPYLTEDFVVMMGDDIYSRENTELLTKEKPSLLSKEVDNPSIYGVWKEKDGFVSGFYEKPEKPISNLANCGLYLLEPEIFRHIKKLNKTVRGEYELNEAVNEIAKEKPVRIVKANEGWNPFCYPWDLLKLNRVVLEKMEPKVEGEVEEGVTIKGKVSIGKGTRVLSGAYIQGPVMIGKDCLIGPNCYIRPHTSIGDNCKIGQGSEVKNSVIGDGTKSHLNYVGDSVIGDGVNLAAGTMIANLRHDRKIIKSMVKGELVWTGREKFGAAIGDDVKLGARTIIYPGRKIWPGKTTLPGEIVKKDIV
jgi:bifunctional UDP-N-acetylglucosamine pyrophosphorylase/glucosamine-1-phosphate N-acetyltransferase